MNSGRTPTNSLFCNLVTLLFLAPVAAHANFTFSDTPLKVAFEEIQQETGYFFLFRESQVADISVTFESTE